MQTIGCRRFEASVMGQPLFVQRYSPLFCYGKIITRELAKKIILGPTKCHDRCFRTPFEYDDNVRRKPYKLMCAMSSKGVHLWDLFVEKSYLPLSVGHSSSGRMDRFLEKLFSAPNVLPFSISSASRGKSVLNVCGKPNTAPIRTQKQAGQRCH